MNRLSTDSQTSCLAQCSHGHYNDWFTRCPNRCTELFTSRHNVKIICFRKKLSLKKNLGNSELQELVRTSATTETIINLLCKHQVRRVFQAFGYFSIYFEDFQTNSLCNSKFKVMFQVKKAQILKVVVPKVRSLEKKFFYDLKTLNDIISRTL